MSDELTPPAESVPYAEITFTVLRCTCGEPAEHEGQVCPLAVADGTFTVLPTPAEE